MYVYHQAWIWSLLCPRLALKSEICLPQSPGIKGMYYLAGPKLFMATKLVFQPQDLDHKYALHFWIAVPSRCSQVDNQK